MKNLIKHYEYLKQQLKDAEANQKEAQASLGSSRYNFDDSGDYINMSQDVDYWDARVIAITTEMQQIKAAIDKYQSQDHHDVIVCGSKVLLRFDDTGKEMIVMISEVPVLDLTLGYSIATKDSPMGQLLLNKKAGFSGTYYVKDMRTERLSPFNVTVVKILI